MNGIGDACGHCELTAGSSRRGDAASSASSINLPFEGGPAASGCPWLLMYWQSSALLAQASTSTQPLTPTHQSCY